MVPPSRSAAKSAPPHTVPAVTLSSSVASNPAPRKRMTSSMFAPGLGGSARVAVAVRIPEPRTNSVRPISPCSRNSFQIIARIMNGFLMMASFCQLEWKKKSRGKLRGSMDTFSACLPVHWARMQKSNH
jgi:hypothetical protein